MIQKYKKILFVCLGNICRSPMAEGIFQHLVENNNLENDFHIDSAGTSAHHVGEKADERMRNTALAHNIKLTSRSRQVIPSDFDEFDLILAMDKSNFENLTTLAINNGKSSNNIRLMREFDSNPKNMNVPDPYYGGEKGFEDVFGMLSDSCHNLLNYINNQN